MTSAGWSMGNAFVTERYLNPPLTHPSAPITQTRTGLTDCDQWELPCFMCVTDSLSALIFLSNTLCWVTPMGRLETDDYVQKIMLCLVMLAGFSLSKKNWHMWVCFCGKVISEFSAQPCLTEWRASAMMSHRTPICSFTGSNIVTHCQGFISVGYRGQCFTGAYK